MLTGGDRAMNNNENVHRRNKTRRAMLAVYGILECLTRRMFIIGSMNLHHLD